MMEVGQVSQDSGDMSDKRKRSADVIDVEGEPKRAAQEKDDKSLAAMERKTMILVNEKGNACHDTTKWHMRRGQF